MSDSILTLTAMKARLDARLRIATARREAIDRCYTPLARATHHGERLDRLSDALETACRLVESIGDRADKVALALSSIEDLEEIRDRSRNHGRESRKRNRAASPA